MERRFIFVNEQDAIVKSCIRSLVAWRRTIDWVRDIIIQLKIINKSLGWFLVAAEPLPIESVVHTCQ